MSAFSSLNGRTLTFTDNRLPNVITDFPVAFDINETGESNVITLKRNIDILDVVKPDLADCRLIVDVSSVAGTTMDWGTLPSGVAVTVANGVYTVTGIDSKAIWDTIKEPTITISAGFQGSFSYDVDLRFYNGTDTTIIDWNVGTFIPVAILRSTASITIDAFKFKGLADTKLQGVFNLVQVFNEVQIVANTSLSVIPEYIFTNAYLSLIEPVQYDPLTEIDFSSISPRVTANGDFFTQYQLQIFPTSGTPFEYISSEGYESLANQSLTAHQGVMFRFVDNYSKIVTGDYDSFNNRYIFRLYSYPDKTLIATVNVTYVNSADYYFTANGNIIVSNPASGFTYYTLSGATWNTGFSYTVADPDTVIADQTANTIVISDSTNVRIYRITSFSPLSISLVGTIAEPANTISWGHFDGNITESTKGIRISNDGTSLLIGRSASGGIIETYWYKINSFSPFSTSLRKIFNNSIGTLITNSSISLVGAGASIYNTNGTVIQTFISSITAISDDETTIVTTAPNGGSYVYQGNKTSGWSIVDSVPNYNSYNYVNSNNTILLDDNNRATKVSGNGFTQSVNGNLLTLTDNKDRINQSLNTLTIKTNNVSSVIELNYKLTGSGVDYTRRQDLLP